MDKLLPLFPLNSKVKKEDVVSLVIAIVIYVVASSVVGWVLTKIPLVGGILATLVGLYALCGIILAIYSFIK